MRKFIEGDVVSDGYGRYMVITSRDTNYEGHIKLTGILRRTINGAIKIYEIRKARPYSYKWGEKSTRSPEDLTFIRNLNVISDWKKRMEEIL